GPSNQLAAETDGEGLDRDTVPAGDKVVAHIMHKDDDRQDRKEWHHIGQEPEEEIEHVTPIRQRRAGRRRSPVEQARGDGVDAAASRTDQQDEQNAECKAIKPVHEPAVAGNDVAAVLNAEMALHGALAEIPQLAEDA